MRNTIMTEKLARRGVRVPAEYAADFLDQISVAAACTRDVVAMRHDQTVADVHELVATHQGFPVVDDNGDLLGVVTRRDFIDAAPSTPLRDLIRRPPSSSSTRRCATPPTRWCARTSAASPSSSAPTRAAWPASSRAAIYCR